MKEIIEKLKAISETLEGLEIEATMNNLNRLLGCQQVLQEIIREAEQNE